LLELRGVGQGHLEVDRPPLQPEELLAARVRLPESDDPEGVSDRQQRAHDGEAEEQLRPERQWDPRNRANQRVIRGSLRLRRGFDRLLRDLHPRVIPRPETPLYRGKPVDPWWQ